MSLRDLNQTVLMTEIQNDALSATARYQFSELLYLLRVTQDYLNGNASKEKVRYAFQDADFTPPS